MSLGSLLVNQMDIASQIMSHAKALRPGLEKEVQGEIRKKQVFPNTRSKKFVDEFIKIFCRFALFWHTGYYQNALDLLGQQIDYFTDLVNVKKGRNTLIPTDFQGSEQGWNIYYADPHIIGIFGRAYWRMLRYYFGFLNFYGSALVGSPPAHQLQDLGEKLKQLKSVVKRYQKYASGIQMACEWDQKWGAPFPGQVWGVVKVAQRIQTIICWSTWKVNRLKIS